MSQHAIGIVIDRLLTDEDLRVRFARDRIETLTALVFQGVDLTPHEIALFVQTDARLWFCSSRNLQWNT